MKAFFACVVVGSLLAPNDARAKTPPPCLSQGSLATLREFLQCQLSPNLYACWRISYRDPYSGGQTELPGALYTTWGAVGHFAAEADKLGALEPYFATAICAADAFAASHPELLADSARTAIVKW